MRSGREAVTRLLLRVVPFLIAKLDVISAQSRTRLVKTLVLVHLSDRLSDLGNPTRPLIQSKCPYDFSYKRCMDPRYKEDCLEAEISRREDGAQVRLMQSRTSQREACDSRTCHAFCLSQLNRSCHCNAVL